MEKRPDRITSINWGEGGIGALRLAALGKIKIGGKGEQKTAQSGNKYRVPKKFDHFVITTRERGEDENFVPNEALMKRIHDKTGGEKLWSIPVVLMYDSPELNFPHRLACYDGQTLVCQGDGTAARRKQKGADVWGIVDCPCKMIKERKCKPHGILSVVLPDDPRVGAVYELATTSWETCRNIFSSMAHISLITNGILAGIPLHLEMYPATDTYDQGGTTKKNLNYKIALTFQGGYKALANSVQEAANARMAARVDMRMLEDGRGTSLATDLSIEDHTDTTDEFFPDTDDDEAIEIPGPAPRPMPIDESKVDPPDSEVEVIDDEPVTWGDADPAGDGDEPDQPPAGSYDEEPKITNARDDDQGNLPINREPTDHEKLEAKIWEIGEALGTKPDQIKAAINSCEKKLDTMDKLRLAWGRILNEQTNKKGKKS